MIRGKSLLIAVDFDGTIVEDVYPKIGKPKHFAFDSLIGLQNKGHRIILWTYRKGKRLEEAVEFCREKGLEFYAVNHSFPEEQYDTSHSRKINADMFIDDRNIGGLPAWGEIYQQITQNPLPKYRKKGLFSIFKSFSFSFSVKQ